MSGFEVLQELTYLFTQQASAAGLGLSLHQARQPSGYLRPLIPQHQAHMCVPTSTHSHAQQA